MFTQETSYIVGEMSHEATRKPITPETYFPTTSENNIKVIQQRYDCFLDAATFFYCAHNEGKSVHDCPSLDDYLLFCASSDLNLWDKTNTMINTWMLVAALLLNFTASFTMNPPSFSQYTNPTENIFHSASDTAVQIFFYSCYFCNIFFIVSILAGVTLYMQANRGLRSFNEMPFFLWQTEFFFNLVWLLLIFGVSSFTVMVLSAVRLNYTDTQFYVVLIITIVCIFIFLVKLSIIDKRMSSTYYEHRMKYLKKTIVRRSALKG